MSAVSYARALSIVLVTGLGLGSLLASSVVAQEFPTRPVRIVVPFPPGGGVDTLARLIGNVLSAEWSQPVVVENRAGAGGNVGADYVAKSPPDGYTVLISASGIFSTNKLLYRDMPFDPEKDLKPVSLLAVTPNVLVTNPNGPASTFKDLIAYARANPGRVTYASQGAGTSGNLSGAYLAQAAKIDIVHVPYRGGALAWNDVLGGHVTMMWDGVTSVLSGTLRPLAIASRERSPALPGVPTVIESGLPGFESNTWYGAAVASGTPDALAARLSAALARAVRRSDIAKGLTEKGTLPIGSSPEELAAYIKEDIARWKPVIEAANIKIE
jgi:tripartite-type tricarboxylate transporter receptor subunit TctC